MKKSIKILFLLCVLFININIVGAEIINNENCNDTEQNGFTGIGESGEGNIKDTGCSGNLLCHIHSTSAQTGYRNVGLRITLVKCPRGGDCYDISTINGKNISGIDIFSSKFKEKANFYYGGYNKTDFVSSGTFDVKSAQNYAYIALDDSNSSFNDDILKSIGTTLITPNNSSWYPDLGSIINGNSNEKNNNFVNAILDKMSTTSDKVTVDDLFQEIKKNGGNVSQADCAEGKECYGYRFFVEPLAQYAAADANKIFILTPTEVVYFVRNQTKVDNVTMKLNGYEGSFDRSCTTYQKNNVGVCIFQEYTSDALVLTANDVGRSNQNLKRDDITSSTSGLGLNIIAPYNYTCTGKDCPNPDGDDPKPVDPPSDDPLTCIVDTSMFTSNFTDEDGNPLACYDNQIKYEDGLDSLGNKNDMCYETDTAMSSKYCTVKCSETLTSNFDTVMPVVEAGKYFTWNNNTLNGSRTCYTNINYNQFISDIRSANAAVSEAYYNNNSAKISSLDFNSDGKVDYDDFEIYQLYKSGENIVINGKTLSKEFDINKDGFYNYEVDTEYFLVVLNLDVNGDTTINKNDLTQLEQNIKEFSGKNYDFDVDGDGTITQRDFSIVKVLSNNGGNIPAYIDNISLDYNKDNELNYLDVVTKGANKEYVKLRVLDLVPSDITTTMKNKSDINKDGIVNSTDVNIFSKFMSSNVYPNEKITSFDRTQWEKYYKGFSNSSEYKKAINYLNSLVEEMKKCYDNDVWNSNIYNVDDTTGIFSYSDNNSYSYSGEADVTVNYTDMIDENDCKDTTIQIYEEKNGGIGFKTVSLKKCTNIRRSKSASINFTINNDVYRYILKENQVSIHGKDLANEINKYSVENKGATLNYIELGIGNFPVSFGAKTGIYGRNQANGGDLSLSFYNIGHMINNESKVENYLSGVVKDNINSTYSEYSCKFKVTTGLFTPPDGDQECDPNVDPSCDPNDNPDDGNPSGGEDDCTGNNCLGGIRVIYRPISLTDPFPDINAEGRNSGSNWCTESGCTKETSLSIKNYILNNRGVEDYEIYDIEPMYTFILTPTIIKEIREYNDNNSYASYSGTLSGQTYDFVCNKQGGTCISEYFTHLIDRTNATGTCVADKYRNSNDPSNFEVCRYIKD